MQIDIALTDPQREFVFSQAEYPAIVGGLGSGKTRAGTIRAVLLLIDDRGINVGIFLPTYDLLRLRAMPGVEQDLQSIGLEYTVNKSNFTISVHGYGDIIFRSYGSPERIISFEIAHAIIDELDTVSKDKAEIVWRKISERVRQACKRINTIGVVTTPDQGITGFVYHKWVKIAKKGYELIKASTRSNPFLPDGYVQQILDNYDSILAELYINGEFVSLNQNKVYHFFDRNKHHTTRTIQTNDRFLHVSIDFNIGGCCATIFLIENNNPIAVGEFVSHDTQDFINNLVKYKEHKLIIYPDASGRAGRTNASLSDIGMIKAAGYQVAVKPSNPAIRDRVNAYNALLSHDRLLVNTDTCPELVNALETQGYDKKGDPEKFDDHPAIDDWCFSGDTKININGENILFKDAPEQGLVTGSNGEFVKFKNGGKKGLYKILNIELNSGEIIRSTPEHKFLTLNGWVMAKNLNGETLCYTELYQMLSKNLMEKNTTKVQMGIFTKRLEKMMLLTKGKQGKAYIEKYGYIIMGILKKALLSITLMKTKKTIISSILQQCREVSITHSTLKRRIKKTLTDQGEQLQKTKTNAGHGISQKKAQNGIGSTLKIMGTQCIKKASSLASYVNLNIQQILILGRGISIVQKSASQQREEQAELIMCKESVLFVAINLKQINTALKKHAVVSVRQSVQKETVYCLTTERGSFALSNNIIVSNCDSSGYFLAYKFPIIRNIATRQSMT